MDSAMRAFDAFAACAQHPGLLLFYAGEFTPELISAAAERLRQRLNEQAQGDNSPSRHRLLSTFMAMAQHVLCCAAPVGQPAQRLGRIAVGRLGEHFWVLCTSRIDARQRAHLSAGLDAARASGPAGGASDHAPPGNAPEALPAPQVEALDEPADGGAGLGWLRIARDSSAPLEYGFFCGPPQDGMPCTHLHVRAWI